MNLKNCNLDTPPCLIADLNGRIIFIDNSLISAVSCPHIGDNISEYLLENYTLRDGYVEIIKTKNLPYNTALVQIVGQGLLRTIQVQLWNVGKTCAENEQCDKKLFESYPRIVSSNVCGSVDLNSYIVSVVDNIKSDIRYAYRKVEIRKSGKTAEFQGNLVVLTTAITGIISILNEIEYRNPIEITVKNILDKHILDFSVNLNTFSRSRGVFSLAEQKPNVAMRLAYVTALCDKGNIDLDVNVMPSSICISLITTADGSKTDKICASIFGTTEKSLVSYAMDLFNYNLFTGTEGEEQE